MTSHIAMTLFSRQGHGESGAFLIVCQHSAYLRCRLFLDRAEQGMLIRLNSPAALDLTDGASLMTCKGDFGRLKGDSTWLGSKEPEKHRSHCF